MTGYSADCGWTWQMSRLILQNRCAVRCCCTGVFCSQGGAQVLRAPARWVCLSGAARARTAAMDHSAIVQPDSKMPSVSSKRRAHLGLSLQCSMYAGGLHQRVPWRCETSLPQLLALRYGDKSWASNRATVSPALLARIRMIRGLHRHGDQDLYLRH